MANPPSYEELRKQNQILVKEAAHQALTRKALENDIEQYRALVENAPDLIHSVTPDGSFLYTNQAWKNALGYTAEELKTLKLMDIVEEGCRDKCHCIFENLLSGENIARNETVFVAKDGHKVLVEGQCTTSFLDGKATRMTGFFRDIGERSHNEQALRESESRYRDLFENAHDIIQILQPDGKLLYVNNSWRQTFGYDEEEIKDLSIFDIISPDCQDHCEDTFGKIISEEKTHYITTIFTAKNGRQVLIEGNAICKFEGGKPLYTQCIFRDVTEKKRMEEELIKAQKLESVGVFAGGIAHDFNNLLQAIIGNISLAKMYIDPQNKAYERLEKTEKASVLAQNLTQQLLTFSKGGEPIKSVTALSEIVTEATTFSLRGSKVKCHYQLADNLWPVEADKGQLSQVTQNLAINASQAMPEGGILTIRATNITLDASTIATLPDGNYIKITFQDQGSGISKENITKIFDPYFSSKKAGSGLGLAISYSIINNHGGLITADSQPGQGALFTIYLPAAQGIIPAQKKVASQSTLEKGRILVLDDDEIVLDVLHEMLTVLGCENDAAKEGNQAIALYKKAFQAGKPYSGVIMDLTIPGGMGGKETLALLQQINPEVRAIVSSGYANDPIMANFRAHGFCGVFPKPYTIEDLSQALTAIFSPT